MTRTAVALLGAGFVAVVIAIVLLTKIFYPPEPETRAVEITAPTGTKVYAKLPDESKQHLGDLVDNSLAVDVPIGASVILRHQKKEKTFPPDTWENGKIVWQPEPTAPKPTSPRVVSVFVNAVPWAEVFIKLPGADHFIIPRREHFTIPPSPDGEKPNVTPIRGGLKVPVGTTIKLEYGDKEKTFSYEAWKTGKTISHDFMEP